MDPFGSPAEVPDDPLRGSLTIHPRSAASRKTVDVPNVAPTRPRDTDSWEMGSPFTATDCTCGKFTHGSTPRRCPVDFPPHRGATRG